MNQSNDHEPNEASKPTDTRTTNHEPKLEAKLDPRTKEPRNQHHIPRPPAAKDLNNRTQTQNQTTLEPELETLEKSRRRHLEPHLKTAPLET